MDSLKTSAQAGGERAGGSGEEASMGSHRQRRRVGVHMRESTRTLDSVDDLEAIADPHTDVARAQPPVWTEGLCTGGRTRTGIMGICRAGRERQLSRGPPTNPSLPSLLGSTHGRAALLVGLGPDHSQDMRVGSDATQSRKTKEATSPRCRKRAEKDAERGGRRWERRCSRTTEGMEEKEEMCDKREAHTDVPTGS